MDWTAFLDYFFLFLFGLCEVLTYGYYFKGTPLRSLKRARNLPLILLLAALLFLWSYLSMTSINTRDIYSIPYIAQYYGTLSLAIWLFFDMLLRDAVYHALVLLLATRGIRHLVGHSLILLSYRNFLVEGYNWIFRVLSISGCCALYLLMFYFLRRLLQVPGRHKTVSWAQVLLALVSVVPMLYVGSTSQALINESWMRGLDAILIEGLISLCGLLCVLGYGWMLESQQRQSEVALMERTLALQHEQYEIKRELIDSVNQYYHDMKNHLRILEQSAGEAQRKAYIRSLQEEIRQKEIVYETGNPTLDVVLYDKSQACQQLGISPVFITDGAQLAFMRPTDITTIFGNALDNAIEHVRHLENPGLCEILVKVSRYGEWIAVHVDNHCDPALLRMENDEFRTTKAQSAQHGFGLKNIRNAAERYGGCMTTEVKEGHFILNILFPVREIACAN